MLESIEFLHQKGIYHRDIKLDNFVLDKNFQLKLIDFGFATESNAPITGFKGSVTYSPPQAFLSL